MKFILWSLLLLERASFVMAADGNCVKITMTGTGGGPVWYNGLAAHGTLVTYGPREAGCRGTNLQFDLGRGTTLRLSEIGMNPTLGPVRTNENQLDALFLTHVHTDHTEDVDVYLRSLWHFSPIPNPALQRPIDVVCGEAVSANVTNIFGQTSLVTTNCSGLIAAAGATIMASGELDQRRAERPGRLAGGPSAIANVLNFPYDTSNVRQVWASAESPVTVSAIGSTHIPGHNSYRVDTPAGSVVVGGAASADGPCPDPQRPTSASSQVRSLAAEADVLVHAVVHPVMLEVKSDADKGYPGDFYCRQTAAPDLGELAAEAGVTGALMLSHLIPSIDATVWGMWNIPDGGVSTEDWRDAVAEGGWEGRTVVGGDLTEHCIGDCPATVVYGTRAKKCVPMAGKERCQDAALLLGKDFQELSEPDWPGGCAVSASNKSKFYYNDAHLEGTRCTNARPCVCQPYDLELGEECTGRLLTEVACEDVAAVAQAEFKVISKENKPRGCYRSLKTGLFYFNKSEGGTGCKRGLPCVCHASEDSM